MRISVDLIQLLGLDLFQIQDHLVGITVEFFRSLFNLRAEYGGDTTNSKPGTDACCVVYADCSIAQLGFGRIRRNTTGSTAASSRCTIRSRKGWMR